MNPFLGVFFHWLGGLASGSFYVPYKGVKKWAWEVYWLAGGFFSWIIIPWVVALIMRPHLIQALSDHSVRTLVLDFLLGSDVGVWRFNIWIDFALFGNVFGNGCRFGIYRAIWYLYAPDL